jgi:hypothetical protein
VARLPVAELVDPANRLQVRHPSGWIGPAFQVRGMLVWGFTAGVLSALLDMAGWSRPWPLDHVAELPPTGASPAPAAAVEPHTHGTTRPRPGDAVHPRPGGVAAAPSPGARPSPGRPDRPDEVT